MKPDPPVRDENLERVLSRMADDYAAGRWTLEQFEEMVAHRFAGRTPIDADGWPLYYEPEMLDGCEQFAS